MKEIPDVLGWPLPEAEASVRDAGFIPQSVVTSPPDRQGLTGPYRVVRQRLLQDPYIELVVASETGGKEVGEDV